MPNFLERINIEVQDHVARVSFCRPEKMNAIDAKMFEAIPQAGKFLHEDSNIRVVILTGSGGNFSAGLDKSNFESLLAKSSMALGADDASSKLEERVHGIANVPQYAAWMWRELPMPVIVAIEGVALGGGLQMALGGDVRIAHPESRFSILELKWGLIPDMSSTQIMRHMIRDDIIRELTYTARIFGAEDALRWGFITHIDDNPTERAEALAKEIVGKNPHAVRASKRVIEQSYYQSAAEGLLTESIEQDQIIGSANQIEAVMAQLQKRSPNFTD